MTGVETAAIRLASQVAGGVALKLASSATKRLRVSWRVRKRTDFQFSKKLFRTWLRRLEMKDLDVPVDIGAPALAASLDRLLAFESPWRDAVDRHSRAVSLVEATYEAMVALAPQNQADALRDHWARARHAQVLETLLASLESPPQVNDADLADLLVRQSTARSTVRLSAFGLSAEEIGGALELLRPHLPSIDSGEVRLLVGPYGAGKSELAELWFKDAIARLLSTPNAPQPVWLHASELRNDSIETVLQRVPARGRQRGGFRIVVDGLDEVEAVVAAQIRSGVTVFASVNQGTSFLLTSRPGVIPANDDTVAFDGLDHEEALLLIERIAGTADAAWSWNPLLIDATRRPFFALGAAVLLRDGTRPNGQADLISRLVERALSMPTAASAALRSSELQRLLGRMAIASTNTANEDDGLAFAERLRVEPSTLVRKNQKGRLEFTLPIFQQWFAAQALLENTKLAELATSSPDSFDRWRWALAVAGISSGNERLDALLEPIFQWNMGAGSWLLNQVSEGHTWFRPDSAPSADLNDAGERVLRATRTVITSLGPLAGHVFPVRDAQAPITIGIRSNGQYLETGWMLTPSKTDRVVDLPDEVTFSSPRHGPWRWDRYSAIPEDSEWPWRLSVERVAASTRAILSKQLVFGPEQGVWRRESAYRTAQKLTGEQSLLRPAFSCERLLAAARPLIQRATEPAQSLFVVNERQIPGSELLDLVRILDFDDSTELRWLAPSPDRPASKASSSWVWDMYSDELLQQFYAEVYGNACQAYDEICESEFASFGWTMGAGADGPFGVVAHLDFHSRQGEEIRPAGITMTRLPRSQLRDALHAADGEPTWSRNDRALVILGGNAESSQNWLTRYVHERGRRDASPVSNPFVRRWSYSVSIADHMTRTRPASGIAARWLWDDLKALSLADGTFPQLAN